MTYEISVAGLRRALPLCQVQDDLYIASFVMLGDAPLCEACAKELLALAPEAYDYLLTAEAKAIPLVHEMARQSGRGKYLLARKSVKVYMKDPLAVKVSSITTQKEQALYLGGAEAELIRGKRVLIVDDVISTGASLQALEALAEQAGAEIAGRMAVLAEGEAQNRRDIMYLQKLPVFNAKGEIIG